jgi:hypothetical protein
VTTWSGTAVRRGGGVRAPALRGWDARKTARGRLVFAAGGAGGAGAGDGAGAMTAAAWRRTSSAVCPGGPVSWATTVATGSGSGSGL